ncbi:hypothetical protein Tco_0079207 [Tanacetum coccineum]
MGGERSSGGGVFELEVYVVVYCSDLYSEVLSYLEHNSERISAESHVVGVRDTSTLSYGEFPKTERGGIFIAQEKLFVEILKKFGFSSVRTASTPMETNKVLTKDEDGEDVDVHLYRSMIGSLMYQHPPDPDKWLISWQCKKQTVLANSTTEAEYIAASHCCGQVLWIQNQMWQSQAPRYHGGAPAKTKFERVLEKPNEPPLLEGHTSGSREGRMEHQFELTANVPITLHDSPLLGGYIPKSDEDRLKLQELMIMCTKLSKQVLDLKKEKDAQALEILRLKKNVKRLKRQRKSSTSQPRRRKYIKVESSNDDLNKEDASKQGTSNDTTKQ